MYYGDPIDLYAGIYNLHAGIYKLLLFISYVDEIVNAVAYLRLSKCFLGVFQIFIDIIFFFFMKMASLSGSQLIG